MKNKKSLTIKEYLKEETNKELKILLEGYYLKDLSIDLFFKVFEEVDCNPKSVADFIKSATINNETSYKLAIFGMRTTENNNKRYENTCYNSTGLNYNIDDEDYYYEKYFR